MEVSRIDKVAERFAARVYSAVEIKLSNKLGISREMVEREVAAAVRSKDYSGAYKKDGGRMVEYVTDSLCSLFGI